MLQNAHLDAKIGVDPAENEPRREWWCRGRLLEEKEAALREAEALRETAAQDLGSCREELSSAVFRLDAAAAMKTELEVSQ